MSYVSPLAQAAPNAEDLNAVSMQAEDKWQVIQVLEEAKRDLEALVVSEIQKN